MWGRHTSIHLNAIWCSIIGCWALCKWGLWCALSRIRFPHLANFMGLPRFGSLCQKIFTAGTTLHLKIQKQSQRLPNILDEAWTQINFNYLILFIVYLLGTPMWPSSQPLIVCKVLNTHMHHDTYTYINFTCPACKPPAIQATHSTALASQQVASIIILWWWQHPISPALTPKQSRFSHICTLLAMKKGPLHPPCPPIHSLCSHTCCNLISIAADVEEPCRVVIQHPNCCSHIQPIQHNYMPCH